MDLGWILGGSGVDLWVWGESWVDLAWILGGSWAALGRILDGSWVDLEGIFVSGVDIWVHLG